MLLGRQLLGYFYPEEEAKHIAFICENAEELDNQEGFISFQENYFKNNAGKKKWNSHQDQVLRELERDYDTNYFLDRISRKNALGMELYQNELLRACEVLELDCSSDFLEMLEKIMLELQHLTDHQRLQLKHLILNYQETFGQVLTAGGQSNFEPHEVKLKRRTDGKEQVPIKQKPYRYYNNREKRKILRSEIQMMLKAKVIEPGTSPWRFPVVIVEHDGKYRFAIDYRKLNDITVGDSYPLPLIETVVKELGGKLFRSALDLTSGFSWQIPLSRDSQEKTAFVVEDGQYFWLGCPFGLKNLSSSFQRAMNVMLAGLSWIITINPNRILVLGCQIEAKFMLKVNQKFRW